MLSPDSERYRSAFFTYFYCKHLFKNESKFLEIKKRLNYPKIIKDYDRIISKEDFHSELRAREQCVSASGIIMRLMHTMHSLGIVPSLDKAKSLFLQRFSEKEQISSTNPFYKTRSAIIDYYKDHYDVLHLCAAYKLIKPLKHQEGKKLPDRIKEFVALSELFLETGSFLKKGNPSGRGPLPLVDINTAYHFCMDAIPDVSLDEHIVDYPEEDIRRLLSTYSDKTRHERFPKKNKQS